MSGIHRTDSASDKEKVDLEGTAIQNNSDPADLHRFDTGATHWSDRALDVDAGLDLDAIKRLKRKVDLRLVPILAALYAVSLIDRTNLSIVSDCGAPDA